MGQDKLQLSRLELKYRITEETALRIRDFVRSYLEVDEYGANDPNFSYPIHSVYLDSDDLKTYWHTINGDKNRYKLRLRYYDDRPTSPVFFELKRRMNDAILKQRGGVRREAVEWLLRGQLPEPEHLLSGSAKQLVALQRFSHLMHDLQARPKAHIFYLREAWVSTKDNSARVTMDRDVQFEPQFDSHLTTQMRHPVRAFAPLVILEMKFTGRFPNWYRDLAHVFNLNRTSAAKYADGVTMTGEDRFYAHSAANGHRFPSEFELPEGELDGRRHSNTGVSSMDDL